MKKITTIIALSLTTSVSAFCQQAAHVTATQVATMSLHNILEIAFTNTDGGDGGTVSLPFNTMSDYTQGVSSSEQVLRIRSNNKFGIEVKANSSYFDYNGSTAPAPNMPVDSVLNVEVSQNSTGGILKAPFSPGKFVSISGNDKSILDNCRNGNNQQFAIKYKAAPGITYPVGTYTVDIVYTATQQ